MSTACTCNQRIINGSWADCHRNCGWSMSETDQLIFVWLLTSYWCHYNFRVYTWKKKPTNKTWQQNLAIKIRVYLLHCLSYVATNNFSHSTSKYLRGVCFKYSITCLYHVQAYMYYHMNSSMTSSHLAHLALHD